MSVLQIDQSTPETLLIVDFQALNLGKAFPGFILPPGLHLILVTPQTSPLRIGRFIVVPEEHTLLRYAIEGERMEKVAARALKETPHEFTQPVLPQNFKTLSDKISPDFLTKTLGPSWELTTLSQLELLDLIPSKTWSSEDTGSIRTERARDSTWYLLESGKASRDDLLATLQFSFLCAALAGNPDCSLCWESIVRVMLKVQRGNSEQFMGFLWDTIFGQLRAMESVGGSWEESGLGDVVEGEGWFVRGLRGLWRYIDDEDSDDVHESVKTAIRRIKEWGEKKFEWVVDIRQVAKKGMVMLEDGEELEVVWKGDGWDEEEYAPVVVEL